MNQPMLTPMLALIVWTFVVWMWMYATRIPAMQAAGIDAGKLTQKADLDGLPVRVKQIADNYNHLHEQPTIFYALVAYCVLAGTADATNIALAWAYVGARVAHSIVQCTWNYVPVRFTIFSVGSLVLMAIAVRCLIALAG
jgi:hypothetical protein